MVTLKGLPSLKSYPMTYTVQTWRTAGIMSVAYLMVYVATSHYIPAFTQLNPAPVILLVGLYFGGVRLWPVATILAFLAGNLAGAPFTSLPLIALTQVIPAAMGAFLLRRAPLDPLFRRYSDMFNFVATIGIISLFGPTIFILSHYFANQPHSAFLWGRMYASTLLSFLILTPFLLRWCSKPRFTRSPLETFETVVVFAFLIEINYVLFYEGVTATWGIPLIYFLLIPLFWIALRLRPRFLTLALLITTIFALIGTFVNTSSTLLSSAVFEMEVFIIVISTIFFVIVSLEEDRRINTSLMRNQLGALENAIARISSESQAKNDFIAILAHELRNPLAPVVSAIDLLKLTREREPEEFEMLLMMEDRLAIVRRLLDDLLDVSRISEGKLILNKELVDLKAVIKRATLSTAHHIKERHQTLTLNDTSDALMVHGDAVRLEQIFSNLLTNASKYSDPGDKISLSLRKVGSFAEIRISDTGIGISSQTLEHIFTPFHQVGSGVRSQKGLGIGLALVKSFVEIHQGTVTATSKGLGHGSQFTVLLPLSAE